MIKQAWRLLRIFHIALIASLGIYGVVLAVFLSQPASIPAEAPVGSAAATSLDPRLLLGVFLGLAAITYLGIIPVLRRALMPPRERAGDSVNVNDPMDPAISSAFTKLRAGCIMTWALCESVAIYGLMLSFLVRDPTYYAGFGASAALAMIYFAPSRNLIEQVVRAARNAT